MKHNKKRNVGIVYELLLKHISKSLLENNKREAKKAAKIIEKRFGDKNSEIYKEFRLFNALANSKVKNTHTVASILQEAKSAARKNFNFEKLEKEKSLLLKEINYTLSNDFYYTKLKNYRDLGAIHLAINEWRKNTPDLRKLVMLESKIAELMLEEKSGDILSEQLDASHTDRLVLKILTEKFNKHYNDELTADQKIIIEQYVFLSDKENNKLETFFETKRLEALRALVIFENKSENKYLLAKLDEVKQKISNLSTQEINDDSVVKFLTLTKMINEITKEV